MKRALLIVIPVGLLVSALAGAQPSTLPAASETPAAPETPAVSESPTTTEPSSVVEPVIPKEPTADAEGNAEGPAQSGERRARAPGPPGDPYDLIPIPPLSGTWAYGAELVAAMGAGQLLNLVSCVPLVGPVIYGVMAPPYIVEAIAAVAGSYTSTGARDPGPALTTTYVIEGLRAAYMFVYQAALLAELSGLALIVVGQSNGDVPLAQAGGALLGGGLLTSASLLLLLPAELVAVLLGPHIEVLAYRYFDAPEDAEDAPAPAVAAARAR